MARALHSDQIDPSLKKQKEADAEWLASLPLLRELTQQEKQEEDDRLFAAELQGMVIERLPEEQRCMAMLLDDDEDCKEQPRTTGQISSEIFPVQTMDWRMSMTTNPPARPKKCTSCLEVANQFDPVVPCGHVYHGTCLKGLFMAALRDESLMPPRCCNQTIPVDLPRMTLSERQTFEEKLLEHSTVDRLYCSQPACSTFIPPLSIVNSIGTCPKCRAQTCSICKTASHENLDCPKDTATTAVLELAKKEGWARCYRCRTMVELIQGCYHMTCPCRAEFCYRCIQPWKNCPCPQWDEQQLLAEAQLRTNRINENAGQGALNGVNLVQQVQRMANELRENEECRHSGTWIRINGGARCEECHDFLPQYLNRCSGCQMMACNRCRHNRL